MMGSQDEDREHDTGQPGYDLPPSYGVRALMLRARRPRFSGLREPGVGVVWPLNEDEFMRREIHRNLEQIEQILRRLDSNKAEIARLREETRDILARLAA